MTTSLAPSADLSTPYVIVACGLAAVSLGLLALELRRKRRAGGGALWIAASGAVAVLALLAAILRPVSVSSWGSLVGPKVVVLLDGSRSMDLVGIGGGTRREAAAKALAALTARAGVRVTALRFGEGAPSPIEPGAPPRDRPMLHSDLSAALEAVARAADERPSAIVVISDGRLDRPGSEGAGAAARAALEGLEVAAREGARGKAPIPPVHTVAVATDAPADAAIRAVRTAGAAVAHQPLSLRIEIGCSGGIDCDAVEVSARELREEGPPTPLATGTAHVVDGHGTVELGMTLDRAGARILEVQLKPPSGDTLPENDTRYVTVDVARDRIRVLHVAGRPTYDVRALRMWLKSDASVDVVAFFILRTPTDDVRASIDDLALIEFPVDELFSVHLSSFDAVVLQDFDAAPYGLTKHLPALAAYVDKGGGLIMVGGPNAFVPGNYARTRLASVLPVDLDIGGGSGVDLSLFVPRLTDAGRESAVLAPLLSLIGDELPEMPGTSVVGDALPGATVLLSHPTLRTKSGAPMPVLALGEHGSGRTIALTLDGSHRLLFSAFASNSAGRAHGAFWDAMLGWLMRDPRFEPAVIEPRGGCIAGEETTLVLRVPDVGRDAASAGPSVDVGRDAASAGPSVDVGRDAASGVTHNRAAATVTIRRLGSAEVVRTLHATIQGREPIELAAGKLEQGGYSATVEIGAGQAGVNGPTTRRDFACERGGDEWADPRPDVDRLREIAAATGGAEVPASDAAALPLPEATQVAAERHVKALLPPWIWTLTASAALGLHWIVRRRSGLS